MMIPSSRFTTILLFSFMVVVNKASGQLRLTKAYNRPLTITSSCSDGLQGHWFINGEPAPSNWVQINNNILLPASNWNTYGNISHQCGSVTNIYEVFSLGETCADCLIMYISPHNDICVGDTLNITVTTNRSEAHGSPVTLYVSGDVCNSGGGGDGLVACREEGGDVVQHPIFSYLITAISNGTTNIQAQTTYYGSEYYSTRIVVTIRKCDTPDGDNTNNGTDVTIVTTNTSNHPPTPTNRPGNEDDNNTIAIPTPKSTAPSLPSGENAKDETKGIKLAIIISSVFLAVIVLLLLLAFLWWIKYRKKKTLQVGQELPLSVAEVGPQQVTSDDQISLHQQEYTTVQAGGLEEVMSLPRNREAWLPHQDDSSSI